MNFNVDQVSLLLSLPCVINDDRILTETPIFTSSKRMDETVYAIYVNKGESLVEFLHRIYSGSPSYEMDCSVYSQLSDYVLTGRWPAEGGNILIFICKDLGEFMLLQVKSKEMGYISVDSADASENLSKMYTVHKGQWCTRISEDSYLGLSKEGPRIFSISEWVQFLVSGLVQHLQKPAVSQCQVFLNNIISIQIQSGEFDNWGFFSQRGKAVVTHKISFPKNHRLRWRTINVNGWRRKVYM